MSADDVSIAAVFEQLRVLREKVTVLAAREESQVVTLEGQQTVDTKEAIHLSFVKLQDQIGRMEETLATIAEATGEIPKL
ncbi:MAG: hypothetical protein ACRYF9_22025 [Janthinobacterium lividum]